MLFKGLGKSTLICSERGKGIGTMRFTADRIKFVIAGSEKSYLIGELWSLGEAGAG